MCYVFIMFYSIFMYIIMYYVLCMMYCIDAAMPDRGSFVANRLVRGEASHYVLATLNNAKPAPAPA
jgi:hypothetical protein